MSGGEVLTPSPLVWQLPSKYSERGTDVLMSIPCSSSHRKRIPGDAVHPSDVALAVRADGDPLSSRILRRFETRGPLSLAEAFSPELRAELPPAHWATYLRSISTSLVDARKPSQATLAAVGDTKAQLRISLPDGVLVLEIQHDESWINGIYTIGLEREQEHDR